jgi:hypothetical protein
VVTVRELTPIPSNVAQFAVYYQVHRFTHSFVTLATLFCHFGRTLLTLLTYSLATFDILFGLF